MGVSQDPGFPSCHPLGNPKLSWVFQNPRVRENPDSGNPGKAENRPLTSVCVLAYPRPKYSPGTNRPTRFRAFLRPCRVIPILRAAADLFPFVASNACSISSVVHAVRDRRTGLLGSSEGESARRGPRGAPPLLPVLRSATCSGEASGERMAGEGWVGGDAAGGAQSAGWRQVGALSEALADRAIGGGSGCGSEGRRCVLASASRFHGSLSGASAGGMIGLLELRPVALATD